MKRVVLGVVCLSFLLAVAAMAAEPAGSLLAPPALCPALSTPEVPSLNPAKLPDDPLAGARFASCATCSQAHNECVTICSNRWVCVSYFECNPANPCEYSCDCTIPCPPGS